MSTQQTPTTRVVIVGGGIIGCATAYYLTRTGISDVVIVERDHVASGASGYSAGILTPYSGSNDPGLLALSADSLELHAELTRELPELTGIDYGYDLKPYLRCAFGEAGWNAAREFLDGRRAEGLEADWLTGDQARQVCDWLSDEVEAACVTDIEPTVDSRLLTESLLKVSRFRRCKGRERCRGFPDNQCGQGAWCEAHGRIENRRRLRGFGDGSMVEHGGRVARLRSASDSAKRRATLHALASG